VQQLAKALVIHKEEQLVPDDRAADGGPELVALQRGLHEDRGLNVKPAAFSLVLRRNS